MRLKYLILGLGVVCMIGMALKLYASYPSNQGPTLQLTVQAADTSGATLHYQWRATDGTLVSADAATVNWSLPKGPGIHFAYVLVSNGLGGYTEKRIVINTDSNGSAGEQETNPKPYVAPMAPAPTGDTYRSAVGYGLTVNATNSNVYQDVHIPDALVYMQDTVTGAIYPTSGPVKSDLRGEYLIPNLPPGNNYATYCTVPGGSAPTNCSAGFFFSDNLVMPNVATSDYLSSFPGADPSLTKSSFSGSLTLQDGTPCGTLNEFFGVHSTATATMLDANGGVLGASVRLNELGNFTFTYDNAAAPASVSFACEGAPVHTVPVTIDALSNSDMGPLTLPGVSAPQVQLITATQNGTLVATADFTVPPNPLPSDIVSRADAFLAEKGLDTRLGACQYYKAIGAVKGCDAKGNMSGAISFNDWKRAVKFFPYAKNGVPTYFAAYINKVDLNLARVHQSISYGPNQTAAVVCNHLGPANFFNPTQAEVDAAVDNAVKNKNLVACVAMDYLVSQGVNGNKPFIRFLIFGPSGQLLPSINLDGRREKFVPGTCVVCHGGDHYAGKFAEDGKGAADVGGHFLPYDVGNFEFSSKLGLREQDEEQAIYHLNQNVLNAGPTPAEVSLINGWYANQTGPKKVLDKNYIDPSWPGPGTTAYAFYQNVYARSCRTCHVALVEGYNFDHYQNIEPGSNFYRAAYPEIDVPITTCGGDSQIFRDHSMANSLVTFNRFWLSADPAANTNNQPNQPDLLSQFFTTADTAVSCTAGQTP